MTLFQVEISENVPSSESIRVFILISFGNVFELVKAPFYDCKSRVFETRNA